MPCQGEIAGFLFGFPDLSEAIQRSRGRLTPLSILRLLLEYRRTKWLVVNGAGILPRFQRLGGNALLYSMLEKIASRRSFLYVDAVQIAETTRSSCWRTSRHWARRSSRRTGCTTGTLGTRAEGRFWATFMYPIMAYSTFSV